MTQKPADDKTPLNVTAAVTGKTPGQRVTSAIVIRAGDSVSARQELVPEFCHRIFGNEAP